MFKEDTFYVIDDDGDVSKVSGLKRVLTVVGYLLVIPALIHIMLTLPLAFYTDVQVNNPFVGTLLSLVFTISNVSICYLIFMVITVSIVQNKVKNHVLALINAAIFVSFSVVLILNVINSIAVIVIYPSDPWLVEYIKGTEIVHTLYATLNLLINIPLLIGVSIIALNHFNDARTQFSSQQLFDSKKKYGKNIEFSRKKNFKCVNIKKGKLCKIDPGTKG